MFWNHVAGNGEELCCLGIKPLWADVFGVTYRGLEAQVPASIWSEFLKLALVAAQEQGAGKLMMRLEHKGQWKAIAEALQRLGFVQKLERHEFRSPLCELPSEEGSPLRWMSMQEAGWSEMEIAQKVKECSAGDPEADPSEDPLSYISDWLKDPELTAGPECIKLGFLNGEFAALVVAQVNPKDGWSRLSYLGVHPRFRGQGLGMWVHRHGFAALRAQGGVLYHGGTSAPNERMRRLFQLAGCRPFRVMDEWVKTF